MFASFLLALAVVGQASEIGEDDFATTDARPVGIKVEPHTDGSFLVGIVCNQKQGQRLKELAIAVANTAPVAPKQKEAFRTDTIVWYLHRDLSAGISFVQDGKRWHTKPLLPPSLRDLHESTWDVNNRKGIYIAVYDGSDPIPSDEEIKKTEGILRLLLQTRFDLNKDEQVEVKRDLRVGKDAYPLAFEWKIVKGPVK